MNQFFLNLPSTSSVEHYPDNTVSHFFTRLRTPLSFDGSYECALVEISVPTLWKNIDFRRCRMAVNTDGQSWREFGITPGFYESNERYMKEFSQATQDVASGTTLIHYDERQRRASFVLPADVSLKIYKGTAEVMGFRSGKLLHGPKTIRPSGTVDVNHGVYSLYVYSNIIESQAVGHVESPLLRTVFFNATQNEARPEMMNMIYTTPHYVRVNKSFVQDIEIDIRDHTGHRVPFLVGSSNVKLHFRQIRPSFT